MMDPISSALSRCPFLHGLAQAHGEAFARSIAINPTCPASQRRPAPLLTELQDFATTLQLFHGSSGVKPLPHLLERRTQEVLPPPPPPPAKPAAASGASGPAGGQQAQACGAASTPQQHDGAAAFAQHQLRFAPLASMSLGFGNWPNFNQFFQKHFNQKHQQSKQQRPKPDGQPKPRPRHGPGPSAALSTSSAQLSANNGQCPLRKALGPLAAVVFDKQGHLACPEPIMKMRAALAATKPIRELRPQALPVKFAAMGAVTAILNVPCGAWREHTEKFSTGWFLAVHATIPFIAMLRKAVLMPKYAILFTVACAIAGQAIGAKMERKRLASGESQLGSCPARALVRAKPKVLQSQPAPYRTERQLPVASMLAAASSRWNGGREAPAASSTAYSMQQLLASELDAFRATHEVQFAQQQPQRGAAGALALGVAGRRHSKRAAARMMVVQGGTLEEAVAAAAAALPAIRAC